MSYKRHCVYCRGWIDTRKPYGWDYTQDGAPVHDACARQWIEGVNAKFHSQYLARAEAHETRRDETMERLQALEIELMALEAEADDDAGLC